MRYYDNRPGPWMNMQEEAMPYNMMPGANVPNYSPNMAGNMDMAQNRTYAATLRYPEVYYILRPHVIKAADQLEYYGAMPNENMVDAMCDEIENDVVKLHPDLAEKTMMMEESMQAIQTNRSDDNRPGMQENPMQGKMHDMHSGMMEDSMPNMHGGMMEDRMPNVRGGMMEDRMPNVRGGMMEDKMPEENWKEPPFPARFEDYREENMRSKDDFPGSGFPGRYDMPDRPAMRPVRYPMPASRRRGLLNDIIRILLLSELFRRRRRRYYY